MSDEKKGAQPLSQRGAQSFSQREDQSFSRREDQSSSKREDQSFSRREDQSFSRREDQSFSRRGDQSFSQREDQPQRREHSSSQRGGDQPRRREQSFRGDQPRERDQQYQPQRRDASPSQRDTAQRTFQRGSVSAAQRDEQNTAADAAVNIGDLADCVVEQIMPYGAFVRLVASGRRGMIHISELSFNFVKKVEDVLSVQQNIKARVIKIDDKGRIDLSLKKADERPMMQMPVQRDSNDSFEKKMASFLKVSEAKIADLNSKQNVGRAGRRKSNGHPRP